MAEMRTKVIFAAVFLAYATTASSKDKTVKVTMQQMAIGMRDAFNCGVVVEQYLHGSLKGNAAEYAKRREKYDCAHVEAVLNTLPDQDDQSSQ